LQLLDAESLFKSHKIQFHMASPATRWKCSVWKHRVGCAPRHEDFSKNELLPGDRENYTSHERQSWDTDDVVVLMHQPGVAIFLHVFVI
jgi:hypothetical protein